MPYALVAGLVSFAIIGAQLVTGNYFDLLFAPSSAELQSVALDLWEAY